MKTAVNTALCLLGLLTAAAAFSLDSISDLRAALLEELERRAEPEEREVSLDEYLRNLPEAHPMFKRAEAGGCECPYHPTTNSVKSCKNGRFAPNYVPTKQEDGSSCDCLKEYKCCANECHKVDVRSCQRGGKKGTRYGKKTGLDCCDCPVITCFDCPPPSPKEVVCEGAHEVKTLPMTCFHYNATASHADDTDCWQSSCEYKPPAKHDDEKCDSDCMAEEETQDECLVPYDVCKKNKEIGTCLLKEKIPSFEALDSPFDIDCYDEPPKMVDDAAHGKYYKDGAWNMKSCLPCKKWEYTKTSCKAKDTAAMLMDCHQHGDNALDIKCWKKVEDKDSCNCKTAECVRSIDVEEDLIFGKEDVCPKDHVKKGGVSICMTKRDICLPCPAVTEPADCDKAGRYVVETKDCNGCTVKKCEKAVMRPEAHGCGCAIYKYIEKDQELVCTCPTVLEEPES